MFEQTASPVGKVTPNNNQSSILQFLELAVLQTDFLCDAATILSPQSYKSLFLVGEFGVEHLEFLVPVANKDYFSKSWTVPSGEQPDFFADFLTELPITPAIPFPMVRADLESNLALMYTIQMHLPQINAYKLREDRDELFRRSEQRINELHYEFGRVKLLYYKGFASYYPAVCFIDNSATYMTYGQNYLMVNSGKKSHITNRINHTSDEKEKTLEERRKLLREAITFFEQTVEKAQGYHEIYNTFALYNLGRCYFTLGDKQNAKKYLEKAEQTPLIKWHPSQPPTEPVHYVANSIDRHLEQIYKSEEGVVLPDSNDFEESIRDKLKKTFAGIYGGGGNIYFMDLSKKEQEGLRSQGYKRPLGDTIDVGDWIVFQKIERSRGI